METSRHDNAAEHQRSGERIELMLQKQLKERLDQFKDEVAQRPFFWVAIASGRAGFMNIFGSPGCFRSAAAFLSPFRTGDSADGYTEESACNPSR
jgi:hypothetical protein